MSTHLENDPVRDLIEASLESAPVELRRRVMTIPEMNTVTIPDYSISPVGLISQGFVYLVLSLWVMGMFYLFKSSLQASLQRLTEWLGTSLPVPGGWFLNCLLPLITAMITALVIFWQDRSVPTRHVRRS